MTEQKFEFREHLVSPYIRLAKLIVGGLAIAITFITATVFGYRGRHKPFDPIPQTFLEHPYILYGMSILAVVLIVAWFFLSLRFQDIHLGRWIEIEGHKLETRVNSKPITINLRTASEVSFHIMPMFHILFHNQFHRIGHLRVITRDASYSFYFPVRNDFLGDELKRAISQRVFLTEGIS